MHLIREVSEGTPFAPADGWNVGHLANLGLLLSCDGFSIRLDLDNLNLLFDAAENDSRIDLKDHDGNQVSVQWYYPFSKRPFRFSKWSSFRY